MEAGSGIPDIAMIEYFAIPEYVIKGSLKNLNDYGTAKYKDFYTPGTWNAVNFNGGMYGMPVDSGPMAFFYDKEVFDKAGISEPPSTWDEFYQDAKKIKQIGSYITNDPGNAGFFNAMVWQAGGHPYSTSKDGTKVTVKLTTDKGVQKFCDFWQKMIEDVYKRQGWGQFNACDAAERIHALDPTRPIDATSGWYDQRCGDFHSVHNYFRPLEIYPDKGPLRGYVAEYEKKHKRRCRAAHYAVLPVTQHGVRAFMISEFGGLAQLVADQMCIRDRQ